MLWQWLHDRLARLRGRGPRSTRPSLSGWRLVWEGRWYSLVRGSNRKWPFLLVLGAALAGLLAGTPAHSAVIFADNFEAGISGWAITGTPDWFSGAPADGTHCAQIAKRESLQRTLSTRGYDSVTVSFSLGAKGLSKKHSRVDLSWFNGTSWTVLARISKPDPTADGQLHPFDLTLPASAADNARFALRVALTGQIGTSDRGYIDDIVISGTPHNYQVSLDKVGNGSILIGGEAVTLPWSKSVAYGSELTLQAVADPNNRFGVWTGDLYGSTNPATVTVTKDLSIVANFTVTQYALNLTGEGGSVLVNGVAHPLPWSALVDPGASISLQAVPEAGHAFLAWSGDLTSASNPVSLTVNGDTNIAALFDVSHCQVTIGGEGGGGVVVNGVLYSLPWSASFDYGTTLDIEAYPDATYNFANWTGDVFGSDNPISLVVDRDLVFVAHFAVDIYALDLSGAGGSVKVDGVAQALPTELMFAAGETVTVEAIPDAGTLLWAWGGDITQHTNPVTFSMDGDKVVSLDFRTLSIFPDVPLDQWAAREIAACYYAGIVHGYWDGNYQPTWQVTRDQMAAFIARTLAGGDASVPAGPATPSFPDVPADQWAFRYIEYCKELGIVGGYWDGYHPEWVVTRDQMAVFIARALAGGQTALAAYTPPTSPSFADVPADFWAYAAIEYCRAHNIVHGYADGYHPEIVVTRDQMAAYIARAFGLLL